MKRVLILLAFTATLIGCENAQVVVGVGPSTPTTIKAELLLLGNPPSYEVVKLLGRCDGISCSFHLQGNQNYRVTVSSGTTISATSNFVTLIAEGSDGKTTSWRFHIIGEKDGPYWVKLSSPILVQTLNISVF